MPPLIIPARAKRLGEGLQVGRVLPYAKRRMVGPFIFFDHMGPTPLPQNPAGLDVLPHPHIGLATLTYLFAGSLVHRDSVSTTAAIHPGDVNWMTAGRGITHSERFGQQAGGPSQVLHGIQAWVALTTELEEMAPAFEHRGREALPAWQGKGLWGRLLAGEAYGLRAPTAVHSPLHYVHLELAAGAVAELPAAHGERAVYVAQGAVHVGHTELVAGQLAVLKDSDRAVVATQPTTLMLLGGDPVGHRHILWNFVSSRPDRLEQAAQDWQAHRMALPQADPHAWIPLPEGAHPSPQPFS